MPLSICNCFRTTLNNLLKHIAELIFYCAAISEILFVSYEYKHEISVLHTALLLALNTFSQKFSINLRFEKSTDWFLQNEDIDHECVKILIIFRINVEYAQ